MNTRWPDIPGAESFDNQPFNRKLFEKLTGISWPADGSKSYLELTSELQRKEDSVIASLDPLFMDPVFPVIHEANARQDLNKLVQILEESVPDAGVCESLSFYEAAAAMRDLGILLGSIKKLGTEPTEAVGRLGTVLIYLGEKTALPPRDTLIHYTRWNPADERMRMYTGLPDERELINSVNLSTYPLYLAIDTLNQLLDIPARSDRFAAHCRKVSSLFDDVVKGIVHTRKNVSPEVFTRQLRCFYDPITIYEQEYIGPGAVEMPMFVYDHLLWSADYNNDSYRNFKETYLAYNQESIRNIYYGAKYSLATRVAESMTRDDIFCEAVLNSAREVYRLIMKLKGFRAPHLKVTKAAYASEKSNRKQGSGGYAPDMLQRIMDMNTDAANQLKETMDEYKKEMA